MSRWKELLDNHPIHGTLGEVKNLVSTNFNDTSKEEQAEKRRLLKIIATIEYVLEKVDPEIVSLEPFTSFNTNIRNVHVWNLIKQYSQNGIEEHLVKVNDAISKQLTAINQIAVIPESDTVYSERMLSSLEQNVDEFSASVSDKKDSLTNEMEEASSKLIIIEKQAATIGANLNTAAIQWQEQFSTAQDKRQTDFNTKISDIDKQLLQEKAKFTAKINNFLGDAKDKHQQIEKLYNLVGNDSVSGGYQQTADLEKKQANIWRRIALTCIIVSALTIFFFHLFLFKTIGATFSDPNVIWHILGGISIVGFGIYGATYSARQSNLHRENEMRTRWFSLEVEAIDPFISSLDDNSRHELKKILSNRLFGQNNAVPVKKDNISDRKIFQVIKEVIKSIKSKDY